MFKRLITLVLSLALSSTLFLAHGDATHLTGTITAMEGDHLQIKDQKGTLVMVMLDKTTKYLNSDKKAAKSDLKVGVRVLIDAKMDEKMKMYMAEEVTIGAPATPAAKPSDPKGKPAAPKAGAAKAK